MGFGVQQDAKRMGVSTQAMPRGKKPGVGEVNAKHLTFPRGEGDVIWRKR